MPGRSGARNKGSHDRAIIRIGQEVPENVRRALEAVAEKIVSTARTLAPVAVPARWRGVKATPGELRDSIRWRWVKTRKGWQIRIDATLARNAKGVSYGQYAEWDPLFSKEGRKPFLYPALDAHQSDFDEAIKKAVVEVTRRYGS